MKGIFNLSLFGSSSRDPCRRARHIGAMLQQHCCTSALRGQSRSSLVNPHLNLYIFLLCARGIHATHECHSCQRQSAYSYHLSRIPVKRLDLAIIPRKKGSTSLLLVFNHDMRRTVKDFHPLCPILVPARTVCRASDETPPPRHDRQYPNQRPAKNAPRRPPVPRHHSIRQYNAPRAGELPLMLGVRV